MPELISRYKLHYKCLQRTAESWATDGGGGCGIYSGSARESIPSKKSNDQTGGVCSLFLPTVTCSDYRKYSKCNIRWKNIIYLFFTSELSFLQLKDQVRLGYFGQFGGGVVGWSNQKISEFLGEYIFY